MTRHDVWGPPVVPWFMDRMRHIPVNRQAPVYTYLRARRELVARRAAAPSEAGISFSYTVRPLMRGAVSLARDTGAPSSRWPSGEPSACSPSVTRSRHLT